jgi:molybdopterin-guanine dinucleotide biosynthesis protein
MPSWTFCAKPEIAACVDTELLKVNPIIASERPLIVGVGGFTSEVGKTTLLCELLRAFPGWEAIKTTRGHYRSCGKDPHVCCVSDLLEEEAVIRSGRELTYSPGKDTGRYWDAGAVNVHWVIATDQQVEAGIAKALGRVQAPGVFIEGNSFTKFIEPDFFVMVVRPDDLKIKTTAMEALNRVSAFYVSEEAGGDGKALLHSFLERKNLAIRAREPQFFGRAELAQLIISLRSLGSSLAA